MVFIRRHVRWIALASLLAACGSGAGEKGSSSDAGTPYDAPGASLDSSSLPDGAGSSKPDGSSTADGASRSDGAAEDSSAAGDSSGTGPADSASDVGADSSVKDGASEDSSAVEAGHDSGVPEAGGGGGPLPGGATAFPAPNSQGVCPDPPLHLTFSAPPKLGTAGKIQVFDAATPGTAVAVLDMAATAFTNTIDGTTFNILRPAYVDGNAAVIYLNSQALGYGKTYYVTVDSGAILPPTGTFSVTGTTTWRFSTVAAAPPHLSSLTVALDGSGNFCSVQGATDALPANNQNASQITIASGIYHEIIHFRAKNNVTLLGASRTGTVIEGTNNNNMNPSTVTRSLVGIDASSGLVIDTMTISNLTPQGGSQAEALRLETCDECIVRNTNVNSLQDTLLWDGRLYADNCTISGNVDFVWGGGVAYFNNCVIHTAGQAGAIVQARNAATAYGYVFVDSQLTADSTVSGQVLARIDAGDFPGSHVAYINCTMGSFISPAGWTITDGPPPATLRFWEYQSVDTSGNPIDVSKRIAGSTQISATEAASMRDPTVVLAGWNPQ